MTVSTARTDEDILRCYPVMRQLRTKLAESEFLTRVRRQIAAFGYKLAYVHEDGQVKAVAGIRIAECLCDGRYLYVDDLVTDESERSKGYGDQLFDWIVDHARENGCLELGLDSGVERCAAHRFYFRKRMEISAHHFSLNVGEPQGAAGNVKKGRFPRQA